MGNKTLGKTFLDNFQSQTQPQTSQPQVLASTPLSNKTGLNTQKKTALTQGVLQSLTQGPMQNGLS